MPTRRQFLKSSATAAALIAAPAIVRGQNLNSKLQVAGIGTDGKGWDDISQVGSHVKVEYVAFCDIDLSRTAEAKKWRPEAAVYQDFRPMLAEMGDKIDACTVSTPDHMHAYITLECMRQGKHVYVQKPLTHNIWESRQMLAQAKKSGVITRMGNQIHSHRFYRTGVKAIQDGAIGKVTRVHSWCAATGHGKSFHIDRPKHPVPAPDSVNWDLWVGVAPMRPFGGWKVYHPWGWRDWQDFGNGALGDFGCHILDPVFTALNITSPPTELMADHTGMNDEVWPAQTTVEYLFPGTAHTAADTLRITWYDGGLLPSVNGTHIKPTVALPRSGSIFVGQTGSMVMPHVGRPTVYREDDANGTEPELIDDQNHYHGWAEGCISGVQPSDGFDYACPLTESVLLGNIGVRYRGETLKWDAAAMKITNKEEANKWVTREYRDGWKIEPVS